MEAILAGKVAIVTGFTGSIGQAIAARLAGEGARVMGCGRRQELGESQVQTLRDSGLDVRFITANIETEEAVAKIVSETIAAYGKIDIVVNNAAAVDVIRSGSEVNVVEMPTETMQYEMVVNVFAPFWFYKHSIPAMKQAGGGSFVNCSSVSAHRLQFGMPAYAASKAALEALSKQVAVEYGPHNIRSNCLVLGAIRNAVNNLLHEDAEMVSLIRGMQVLDTTGLPEHVANAALFLASDLSRFTSGADLPVDGGTLVKSLLADPGSVYKARAKA